jgi:hypothetical protein
VTVTKTVDESYVKALASDLSKKVLESEFCKQRRWFVDGSKLDESHILKPFVTSNCWPPASVVQSFGDHWDELPLLPCFEIPNSLDPSELLSDKSHSPTRDELEKLLQQHTPGYFKSHKVLDTALNMRLKEFCQEVNDNGLSVNDLIIGLQAKERESKVEGRFFAMMSWNLRLYFVVKEYLIKRDFLGLFPGITMRDTLNEVQKKILNASQGQGSESHWCYTNHIDYEKWNNHQRYEATAPVFGFPVSEEETASDRGKDFNQRCMTGSSNPA